MEQKKILVIEDGELNRDLMQQLLADAYTVILAADGEDGLKKAREERPDLILMDLGLPVLDGWEVTRRLKTSVELREIPVIAVTSHAMVGDERKAREVGCDDYLTKPIDEGELMTKIKQLI